MWSGTTAVVLPAEGRRLTYWLNIWITLAFGCWQPEGPATSTSEQLHRGSSKGSSYLLPCNQGKQSLPPLWQVSLSKIGSWLPDCPFFFSCFKIDMHMSPSLALSSVPPTVCLCFSSNTVGVVGHRALSQPASASIRRAERQVLPVGMFVNMASYLLLNSSNRKFCVHSTNVCGKFVKREKLIWDQGTWISRTASPWVMECVQF